LVVNKEIFSRENTIEEDIDIKNEMDPVMTLIVQKSGPSHNMEEGLRHISFSLKNMTLLSPKQSNVILILLVAKIEIIISIWKLKHSSLNSGIVPSRKHIVSISHMTCVGA
jgi:hypothetical protein